MFSGRPDSDRETNNGWGIVRDMYLRVNHFLSNRIVFTLLAGVLAFTGITTLAVQPAGATPPDHGAVTGVPRATVNTTYLLALGDSLAAGYQPTDGTKSPPIDPTTGSTDQGYPGSYAADLAGQRHLHLIDLACPGETTASMVGSPAQRECATTYKHEFGDTSQIKAAQTFLAQHRGKVALLTFDLGANDIDNCGVSSFNLSCYSAGQAEVTKELPAIVATLQATLRHDDPKASFVAMNYYDPYLGLAYSPGGVQGTAEAGLSLVATDTLNSHLQTIFKHNGTLIANVASEFKTGNPLPLVSYGGHRVPIDVDDVCRWTWMCPLPGSGSSQNIHPNTAGYRTIAAAFTKALVA